MTTSRETDVLIVGGGPAGLAAATALRGHGLRVLIADHELPPIDKACGEGLMPDSLEALHSLGVLLDGYATSEFKGIKFVGPECSVSAQFPRGRGKGIRRLLLHEALLDRAEAVGVEMLWRTRVTLLDPGSALADRVKIHYKWIIGADGQNSGVRHWAGLDAGRITCQRIGLRRHFRLQPWSEFVEIHWGPEGQAYVTPVSENEVCVALISRSRFASFEAGLEQFPELAEHLKRAVPCSQVRGALTVSRRLRAVARGHVALIGEASGSVDAITGEGLALAFRQAAALGNAVATGNLRVYARAHHKISALPELMARSMLLMDAHPRLRRQTLRAFARQPHLFERLLRIHVGEMPLASVGARTLANMGWHLLTARSQHNSLFEVSAHEI